MSDERRQLSELAAFAAERFEALVATGERVGPDALLEAIESLEAGEARLIVAAMAGNELYRRSGAAAMN